MVSKFASRRTALAMAICFMLLALWVSPTLRAQTVPPVVSSTAIPLGKTDWTATQIWKIIMSSKGDVIAWDGQSNALYQFPADGSAIKTLVPPPPDIFGNGQWATGGIAFDAEDNLYFACRWSGYLLKIPYDPEQKTWNVVISDSTKWGSMSGPASIGGWVSPIDINYTPANAKGNGNFIISDENQRVIYQYTGSGNGRLIASGLKNRAFKMALDRQGNLYFVQDLGQGGVVGIFRIPAGVYDLVGKSDGKMEQSWPVCGTPESLPTAVDSETPVQVPCRVDNNLGTGLNGVTVDAAGNVYIGSQDNPGGGLFKVPVETFAVKIGGTDYTVSMPNAAHQTFLAPVPTQGSPMVDPKGAIYAPLWNSGWNNIKNITKVFLGSAALAAAPLGQEGASSQVMFAFNANVTPAGFTFAQGSQESQDFTEVTGGTCAAGTAYTAGQSCTLNVALKPQIVGSTSGVLAMTADGKTVASTYVHGTGLGSALSILNPPAEVAIRSGLVGPKQVATDRWGNFYVADAGAGKVLQFLHGATDAAAATEIGGDFVAPVGVAVDGAGNVFVADSGKIFEVPAGASTKVELVSGLGASLSLTADGAGNIYVADADNQRVVKIANPDSRLLTGSGIVTVGSGFTAPTAVAADDAGNLFVVDGATLTEVFVSGGQTPLTNELISPVGVALDASGGVYVAQADGVIRIPKIAGALEYTQKSVVALDVAIPNSVAVDSTGRVYITDGEIPGLVSVGTNGALDFGFVTMDRTATAVATMFNIGNQDLTFGSPLYTSTGGSTIFSLVAAGDHCSGQSLTSGSTCSVSFSMTPTGTAGAVQDSGNIQSNGGNGTVALTLLGVGSNSAPSVISSITYAPDQPVYPGNVTVSVSVAPASGEGVPTGKVVLTVDNQPTKPSVLVDGTAQFTLRKPNGGQHVIVATYQGDMNYASSSKTLDPPLVIGRAASTTALTPPVHDPALPGVYIQYQKGDLVTAKVVSPSGSPTGAVVFKEGTAQLGTGTLDANGNASFNTSGLTLGTHVITATYTGDTNFSSSDAASITLYVVNPSVFISAQPPSVNLAAGTPGGATLTLRSVVTFQGRIQLTCGNLPQYSECTFDWPSPEMKVGEPQAVVVTISTNVPINVGAVHTNGHAGPGLWFAMGTFAVGLVGIGFGKKTRYNGRVLMFVCALLIISSAIVGMTACGGDSYTKTPPAPHVATPSGTTAVTITATSGGQVVSLPFTLNVTVQ